LSFLFTTQVALGSLFLVAACLQVPSGDLQDTTLVALGSLFLVAAYVQVPSGDLQEAAVVMLIEVLGWSVTM
jgi:hypothetical protein